MNRSIFAALLVAGTVSVAVSTAACGAPGSAKQEDIAQQVPPLGQLPELPAHYFPPPPESESETPEESPAEVPTPEPSPIPTPEAPGEDQEDAPPPPERVTIIERQPAPPPPPPPPAPNPGPQLPSIPDRISVPIGPGQLHVDLR